MLLCLLAAAYSLHLQQHEVDLGDAGSGVLEKAKDVLDMAKGALSSGGDNLLGGIKSVASSLPKPSFP